MRTLLLASTILLSAGSAVAQETPSNILTPERVFSSPSLNGPVAKGVSLSPDGQLVAFLRSREDNVDVQDLWAAPTGEGEPYKLIDARALVPDAGELSAAQLGQQFAFSHERLPEVNECNRRAHSTNHATLPRGVSSVKGLPWHKTKPLAFCPRMSCR